MSAAWATHIEQSQQITNGQYNTWDWALESNMEANSKGMAKYPDLWLLGQLARFLTQWKARSARSKSSVGSYREVHARGQREDCEQKPGTLDCDLDSSDGCWQYDFSHV